MNNHRQLTLAWRMYAEDNQDFIVYASHNSQAKPSTIRPIKLATAMRRVQVTWTASSDGAKGVGGEIVKGFASRWGAMA
jgi:hypothetical protein